MPNENLEKLVQYARDKKPTDFKALLTTEIGSRIATKVSDIKANLSKTMFQKVEEGKDGEDIEHTHDDGTTHSHPDGDKEHVHEGELPPALKKAIDAKKKKEGGDDDDDEDEDEKDENLANFGDKKAKPFTDDDNPTDNKKKKKKGKDE
jgi:hypothetical protein